MDECVHKTKGQNYFEILLYHTYLFTISGKQVFVVTVKRMMEDVYHAERSS